MRVIQIIRSFVSKPMSFSKMYKQCIYMPPLVEMGTDNFVLNNPELIEKRRAVVKYLNESNPVTQAMKQIQDPEKIGDYNIDVLYNNKIKDILGLCGDDLYEIDSALGLYGLAAYAEVKPETIIKDRNPRIKEIGYGDTSFKNCFYTYLLANENTPINDLDSRFGRMGTSLYEDCSINKFVKTGYNYKLTDLGKDYLREMVFVIASNEASEDFNELFGE